MIVPARNVARPSAVRSSRRAGMTARAQLDLLGRADRQRTESGRVQDPACSVVSVAVAAEIVEVVPILCKHPTSAAGREVDPAGSAGSKTEREVRAVLCGQGPVPGGLPVAGRQRPPPSRPSPIP